jgi:hypothetical protein
LGSEVINKARGVLTLFRGFGVDPDSMTGNDEYVFLDRKVINLLVRLSLSFMDQQWRTEK